MTRKNISFDVNPLFSGPTLEARNRSGSPFRYIPLAEIDVDPDQPRRVFNSEALSELAASIKEFGVLCPILVKLSAGGTYKLISGERRYRACRLLGMDSIPAVIDQEEPDGANTLSKQLVENLQREDLSPMERALALGQLRDRNGFSVRDLAAQLGVSKSLVQRSLEILELPDDLQAALINGAAESKVLLLGQVKDRALRKELLNKLDDLTRQQLEQAVTQEQGGAGEVSHGGTARRKKESPASIEDRRIAEDLQQTLGTRVNIQRNSKKPESGKIAIEFYSREDLDEIYRRLAEPR